MSLAPATLRQRIEARITSELGGVTPPWRVASQAFDAFPGADLGDKEALSFAVGVPSSQFLDPGRRPSAGVAAARTQVVVRFCSLMRADAHVTDYDTALTREATLVATVTGTIGTGGPAPRVTRIERRLVGDGTTFMGEVEFEVFHPYPL